MSTEMKGKLQINGVGTIQIKDRETAEIARKMLNHSVKGPPGLFYTCGYPNCNKRLEGNYILLEDRSDRHGMKRVQVYCHPHAEVLGLRKLFETSNLPR